MTQGAPTYARKLLCGDSFKGVVDDKRRVLRHLISTQGIDRDEEVLRSAGCKAVDYLESNPIVLLNHQARELAIGKALDVVVSSKEVEAETQFAGLEQNHSVAETTYRLYRDRFMRAWSVGFNVLKASRDALVPGQQGRSIMDWELLEYSAVGIPSNPAAVTRMVKAFRKEGMLVLPDGATEEDLGKALGTLPLTKYWEIAARIAPPALKVDKDAFLKLLQTKAKAMMECPECGEEIPSDSETCPECDAKIDGKGVGDPAVPCAKCGTPMPEGAKKGDVCAACAEEAKNPPAERSGGHAVVLRDDLMTVFSVDQKGKIVDATTVDDADPDLRWNRSLSKRFDVTRVQGDPATAEYGMAAKYLDCEVKELRRETEFVYSARMGSHLAAMDEVLRDWETVDVRNLTRDGKECPVEHEVLQLNSTTRRDFVVGGVRFLRSIPPPKVAEPVRRKMLVKVEPDWRGMYVTTYVRNDEAEVAHKFSSDVATKAVELNYLKGESFSISGTFFAKTDETWSDIFLTSKNEAVLKDAVAVVNTQGASMENLGLVILGPPGTGKTMGVRVAANEMPDATFIWVSARDFWRGGGMGTIDHAFDLAKECAPTVLVFEDVDNHMSGEVIDLFKSKMDGADGHKTGVLTIVTTNFPETFPKALIDRPGRFDKVCEYALPDEGQRDAMLTKWAPALDGAARERFVVALAGYSGAHIKALVRFAKRHFDAMDTSEKTETEQAAKLWETAMDSSLAELKEQRDLIDATQAPRYRPHREMEGTNGRKWFLVGARDPDFAKTVVEVGGVREESLEIKVGMPVLTEARIKALVREALDEDYAARAAEIRVVDEKDGRALAALENFITQLGAHDGKCDNGAACQHCQQRGSCRKHIVEFERRQRDALEATAHLRERIKQLTRSSTGDDTPPAPELVVVDERGLFSEQDKDALVGLITRSARPGA